MNRRDLLKGAAVASVAAAVPVAALAKSAPDRSAWDAAMRKLKAAEAARDSFAPVHDEAERAFMDAKARVPHIAVGEGPSGPMSTKSRVLVETAIAFSAKPRPTSERGGAWHDLCSELAAAERKRNAQIEALDRSIGCSAKETHYEALVDEACDLEKALLNMPAPDGEALLWKVQHLYQPGDGIWNDGVEDQTYADLQRFLSHGRA